MFAEHRWRSKEELSSDVLSWYPSHGRQSPGRPGKACVDQLKGDTGCKREELPNAMNDKSGSEGTCHVMPRKLYLMMNDDS